MDNRRASTSIISFNNNGLSCSCAPAEYGLPEALYKRCSDMGVFSQIVMGLTEQAPDNKTLSIDATYLKAHRTAFSLRQKNRVRTPYDLTKGGMATELHALTNTGGHPIRLFITAGQFSDYIKAAALMKGLPEVEWPLANRDRYAD